MTGSDPLRYRTFHLAHGSGELPAAGFGTLIPDPVVTKQATRAALETGFRHLDCAERYRNEEAVGDAIQDAFKARTLKREDCSLPPSYGTPIIVRSESRPPSTRAADGCSSTISTAISSTRPLPFNLVRSRIRGTRTVG